MWTTIAYRDAMENNMAVRLYDDSTEASFELYDDAVSYAAYLVQKFGCNVDTYEVKIYTAEEMNLTLMRKNDALNKLSTEERELLGLNEAGSPAVQAQG